MPLIAGMTATRKHLLEWVHTVGIDALQTAFTAEAESAGGPQGPAPAGAHASSLGAHGHGVDVRRPADSGGPAAGAQLRGAGSGLAGGGGMAGARSADGAG